MMTMVKQLVNTSGIQCSAFPEEEESNQLFPAMTNCFSSGGKDKESAKALASEQSYRDIPITIGLFRSPGAFASDRSKMNLITSTISSFIIALFKTI